MRPRKAKTKYGNRKTVYMGITFDSERERDRYIVLKDAESKGIISELETQCRYELIPAIKETFTEQLKTKTREKERTLQQAITYRCDFRYKKDGETVVEDVKAADNRYAIDKVFFLKEKMMRYFYGIVIKRVFNASDEI